MTAVLDRTASHRESARKYADKKRKAEQGIVVPFPHDVPLREACLEDWKVFLTSCFPDVFYQGFTPDREEMAEAILFGARHGGDQSVAGPRGEGKTRLALFLANWLMLRRELFFPVVIMKNAGSARDEFKYSLKPQFERNDDFARLFPEVCAPIAALEGWASKSRKQHVNGHYTDIIWAQTLLSYPTLPADVLAEVDPRWLELDSCAEGQIFGSVGIEGRIRGWNIRNKRPDLAIIDDVDDAESAKSEVLTAERERIIEADVAGLAGPGQRIARVMLCTLINRRCVAFKFTDPKQKPSWKGKRLRAMFQEPEQKEMWADYVDRRKAGMESGDDPLGREATEFYLANREKMDAGCEMSNPENYMKAEAEDGKPLEYSAIQAFYNKVADFGWASVLTEYQQDPPAEGEPELDGLSEMLVRRRLTGLPRGEVPDGAVLVAQIDLGQRRIHYCATAWEAGAIGSVVDYGEKRTGQPDVYGVENAIRTALDELRDQWFNPESDSYEPYTRKDGEVVPFHVILIDAGHWNDVVYQFVRDVGGPFKPSMGDPHFRMPISKTKDKQPGRDFWYLSRQLHKGSSVWVVNTDPNAAKLWLHARLLTPPFPEDDEGKVIAGEPRQRGSLALFGDDWKTHGEFADHILAERFEREFKEGKKGMDERWKKVRPDNHYLDTLYGCCVGASMAGIRLMGETVPKRRRLSFAERREALKRSR